MLLFGLLWVTLIAALSAYIAYWSVNRSQTNGRSEDGTLGVLQERYARGEIDDEELDRRRAHLVSDNGC